MLIDNFRKNLREAMAERGVNQRELALLSGVHAVTISRILGGVMLPSLAVCESLAKALKMSPEKTFAKIG